MRNHLFSPLDTVDLIIVPTTLDLRVISPIWEENKNVAKCSKVFFATTFIPHTTGLDQV
jgi:hypothetical protein